MEDSVGSVSYPENLSTEILFVTPGETNFDVCAKLMGQLNVALNAKGIAQACDVAQLIGAGDRISAVYSSDLRRALDTAQQIAAVCGFLEVQQETKLRDRDYGPLQGLKSGEFSSASPSAYQALLSADEDIPLQGGVEPHMQGGVESLSCFSARCVACLERLATNHRGKKIVVVSDIAVVKALYKRSFLSSDCPVRLSPTSISVLSFYNERNWRVKEYFNDRHAYQLHGAADQRILENARYCEFLFVRCGECYDIDGEERGLTQIGETQVALVSDYLKSTKIFSVYTATHWSGALSAAHHISYKCCGSRMYTDADFNRQVLVLPLYNEVGIELEPGFGESAEVFISRCRNKLLQIAGPLLGNQYGKAVIVCDETVIRAVSSLCYEGGVVPPGLIRHASVTSIILSVQQEWVMRTYNNIVHLPH